MSKLFSFLNFNLSTLLAQQLSYATQIFTTLRQKVAPNFKLLTFYEFSDQTFFLIHMYDPHSCVHNDPTSSMQTDKGY